MSLQILDSIFAEHMRAELAFLSVGAEELLAFERRYKLLRLADLAFGRGSPHCPT